MHLIACSEDAEEEGSSFPIGLNENTTIGFDDITEQSETSPSAASTVGKMRYSFHSSQSFNNILYIFGYRLKP